MNFVTQLEDYLRDLGAEARKNHPGVKEASERAILKLRSLQNDYAGAVRKAATNGEKHPDTRLFRSSDLLHPFLLAANYPNASPKLLDTSFKAMKTLLEADAICPGDGTNMARVWMIQAQVVVSYSKENIKGSKEKAPIANSGGAPGGNASSSWFGGYFSSTGNGSTPHSVVTKAAISSTHGNAGGSGHLSAKDLEKLALDILSCLLQLLELKDLPVSDDQWIQSVTLCCLLYLPTRQKVRQAAHSTLPQVLSLLFRSEAASRLKVKTWDDLLSCALGMSSNAATGDAKLRSSSNSQMKRIAKISSFHGAFSNCRFGDWEAAQPPSQALALELMTILLPESPNIFDDVGQKTFGVLVQCFQNHCKANSNNLPMEVLKALQFSLVVLQTQGVEWPAECRELVGRLIQPISLATEALRKQVDFEDGYIYKVPNKLIPTKKPSSTIGNKYSIETLQGLPQTVLWKAALSIETLKLFVEDRKSCKKLWLHEDVAALLLEATSDFCTIGASCEEHMNMIIASCRGQTGKTSLAYSAEALDKIEQWHDGKNNDDVYVLGDALWTGFQTLLLMIDQLDESILDQTFAPSLSVLQHYLKRFPASGTIVEKALEGYFSLAKVSLNAVLLRGALLSSLCKLSLPQWGRKDSSSLLKDHNVAALLCLLNIVHRQKDRIGSDWSQILQTFEELSVLAIASPDLSNSAYAGALSISAAYARFSSFSTCLSDESLSQFVASVKEVSLSDKSASTIPSASNGRRNFDKGNSSKVPESRGAKLINIGARAIGWNSDGNDVQEDVPVADRTKNTYYDDYQHEFDNRLAGSRYPIRARQIPFSIALLADAAMANIYRHSRSGADLFRQICTLATEVEAYRPFFMDLLTMLIVTHVMEDEATIPAPFFGPGKIVFAEPRQNQLLAAEKDSIEESKSEPVSQIDLLGPLCEYISTAKTAAVAEGGLEALYTVLESTGHKLESQTWVQVVEAIAAVPSWEHSSSDWTPACQVGFRCLKLIVDDFLEDAAKSARTALLECCSTFGSARHDMNTSLTAIGLLWTIADQDSGTESVDRALAKLVLLAGDHRAEVRNCSVNTLFSCIVGRGQKFTGKQWESCICKTIFGVYDKATSDSGNNGNALPESTKKSRYQVNVHHSRDSADKQWVATQALVLKGMCRLLRNFFDPLLKTTDVKLDEKETPWFDKAWSKILGWAYDASIYEGGRDTLDLRNSGVELMVLCTQLSCAAGIHAAITPARVGTNMEVINGALRSVGSPERSKNGATRQRVHSSDVVEMWRENLFLDAFDNLEEFREHLASESSIDDRSEPTTILEQTQIQVLTKLASELGKLYDCCKGNEFKEDLALSTYTTFQPLLATDLVKPSDNDTMVVRFVRVVRTIAKITSSGKDSRFLSQAQRACLEIFKTMSTDGSPEAFFNLTVFSRAAFYAEKEANGKCKKGVDILSHEMASTLLESYKSKTLTDLCKTIILTRLLSLFQSDNHGIVPKDDVGTSYKMLIPIMQEGLKSAKILNAESEESSQAIPDLLDNTWERVCLTLSRMLSPTISKSSNQDSILHSLDLVDIVNSAAENAPSSYTSDLCTIFFSGASRCLETIRQGNLSSEDTENFLNLFAACFSGMCQVGANEAPTHGIAEQVLTSAYESLESEPSTIDWNVQAALKVCEVLQTVGDVAVVVIAVVAQMSNLVGVEERSMRRAAGAALANANIRGVLEEAQTQRQAAEERAKTAENRVAELERQIVELRKQSQTPAGIL
eukprot:CAMPEP_0116145354 /NCGR_PEP_ID=MMETSP0329-20121206/16543_1 /TAXON_ID=697910 /ORGANISM="Pseudo-nitzschia arenysensis, Strain B593" /LENGTH=1747 /DNA_ID=CAMNT_0003640943 /DNA_START=274 /DNA_END=5514 /DNA_ORIENTATION=-